MKDQQKVEEDEKVTNEILTNNIKFTFYLPYQLAVVNGHVTEDIVITLMEPKGRMLIHPPVAKSGEKDFVYQSSERDVWFADTIKIDIETKIAISASQEEINGKVLPIVEQYLKRFLRHLRVETKQFSIDPKQYITSDMKYTDQNGRENRTFYLNLTMAFSEDEPALDNDSWKTISGNVLANTKIPFYAELLLDAKLYRAQNDYRMAVVSAAMGIEIITDEYLRSRLRQQLPDKERVTETQIDDFVTETSNRLLVTVGLGLFSSAERNVLEGCRDVMQLRNNILHGQKKPVSFEAVNKAINNLEQLMLVDEIQQALNIAKD